jgi:subfamily B ATP-binding cassette protein MsbA
MKTNDPKKLNLPTAAELKETLKILKRVGSYATPYWKNMIVVVIATLIVNNLTLLQPILFGKLLDKALLHKNFLYLKLIVLAAILLVIVRGFFFYVQGYLLDFIGLSCVKKIREELFIKLQNLPVSFFKQWKTGDLISRMTNDTGLLSSLLGRQLIFILNDSLVVIGSLAWMTWKSPLLTLFCIVLAPTLGFAALKFMKWASKASKNLYEKLAEVSHVLVEGISGIQVVKSFAQEEKEIQKFKNKNQDLFACTMKLTQVGITQTPLIETITMIGALVYFLGYEVIQGKFSIGTMFVFFGYLMMAINPIQRLSGTVTAVMGAQMAAQRLFPILDMKTETEETIDPVEISNFNGKVEFEDIWFQYNPEGPWTLKEVNLTADPGTVVALVGPSGAGKTSLVDLIPRFYNPTKGKVKIDGTDIKRLSLKFLRSQVGIVLQDVFLFTGTVRDNIRYGRPGASEEEVIEAAKMANAHDFISRMPQGYDSMVGERGSTLSLGERQRISIARALICNPKILILDEATSSVDAESEKEIQAALESAMKGRTTFVIAHRLSTIRNADKIVTIQEGQIVETGSHEELLASSGIYSRFHNIQVKAAEA